MGNVESTPTRGTETEDDPKFDNEPSPSRTLSTESEDELTGYSKVMVSNNLAEEILDEIYGKMAVDDGSADYFASGQPFFLFQAPIPREVGEAPRSLADEILEELYGENQLHLVSKNLLKLDVFSKNQILITIVR